MAKAKPEGAIPKELEAAYQLWAKGDYRAARKEAKRVLADKPAAADVQALAERVLADTLPDMRAIQVGVGGIVFVAVILLLLFH